MLREIETDDLRVQYEVTDETFDHAFGREKRTGYEIDKIEVFIPALNEWADYSHLENPILEAKAKQLIEKDMA
jgi:hypothetical protein